MVRFYDANGGIAAGFQTCLDAQGCCPPSGSFPAPNPSWGDYQWVRWLPYFNIQLGVDRATLRASGYVPSPALGGALYVAGYQNNRWPRSGRNWRHYVPLPVAPAVAAAPPRERDWGANPPVVPPWLVPRLRGVPGTDYTRHSGYAVPRRPYVARPFERVIVVTPPGARPVPPPPVAGTPVRPGVGVGTSPVVAVPAQPTKETKQKLDARLRQAFQAMALYSEANDVVSAIWRCLPRGTRKRYANTPWGRARAIVENIAQINMACAAASVAVAQVSDYSGAARNRLGREVSSRLDPTENLWRTWQTWGI